jgi:hypothetical protein
MLLLFENNVPLSPVDLKNHKFEVSLNDSHDTHEITSTPRALRTDIIDKFSNKKSERKYQQHLEELTPVRSLRKFLKLEENRRSRELESHKATENENWRSKDGANMSVDFDPNFDFMKLVEKGENYTVFLGGHEIDFYVDWPPKNRKPCESVRSAALDIGPLTWNYTRNEWRRCETTLETLEKMWNYTRNEWRRCDTTLEKSGEDVNLHSFRVYFHC